jgi:aspartate aminotransferase
MKPISSVALAVQASTTMAIDAKAKQMKADGIDVVGFGAGEPDFKTPDNINMAGIAAICDGKTKYTPAAGIIPLRKAAAARLEADCGTKYDYTQIVIASGAKHCVYVALAVLTNPGDEIVVPAPYWVSYCEMIRMTGGVPVELPAGEAQNFKITPEQLEAAITDKTKCVILNNPCNPTGMLYTRDELEAIARVCAQKDVYVIADEIYYKLVYDGREFVSFASLGEDIKERTIIINGVSKSYAMTGWRIGFAAANKQIAKVMSNFLSHSTGAPSTISQWAAVEALNGPQEGIENMRRAFEGRRDYMYQRMNSIDGVSCIKPEGAFYIMMNIEKLIGRTIGGTVINTADDFAMAFLDKGLVAVVPCTGFGIPNFIRWSYATSMDNIREGLDRLEKFLA